MHSADVACMYTGTSIGKYTKGREGGDLIIVESTILELWVLKYLGTSLPTLMNTLTLTA